MKRKRKFHIKKYKPANSKRRFTKGKALLIGINYNGTGSQLNGCINDVHKIYKYLIHQCKFDPDCIHILTDDDHISDNMLPTKANIIREIKWLTLKNDSNQDTSLFFHYSGHGSYVYDRNGDEKDRRDETICPLDYAKVGFITDDHLRKILVEPLDNLKNVHLTCLLDCCHSGTLLDLRYNYRVIHDPKVSENVRFNITQDKHYKKTTNKIIVFSGCMDKQYSADAWIERKAQGAMTWAFVNIINKYKKSKRRLSYKKFIRDLQMLLKKNGYKQIPQLTTGRYLSLKDTFCL